ncbi:E3 ubiquitin-protein ligase MARCHF6 isoform X1 [Chelonia mydas]|nr:E3 ubiquitin-protein ligase MARCHF6 isoform X1 [Chelonia mydas]
MVLTLRTPRPPPHRGHTIRPPAAALRQPDKMETAEEDICRVCRSEGTPEKPLYHPCVCTGSIKFIHQECLVQWLKHSRKEYCELCKHRFAFTPIYSPDMPSRLPIQDIFAGLVTSIGTAIRYWFHYTLVAFAWLGVVPLTACRIYKCLFTGSVSSLLTLPLDMLSTENLLADCLQGCFVVTCTLCAFISLVWLREQIVHGGAPQWLEQNQQPPNGLGQQNEAQGLGNGGGENAALDQPANPPAENAVVGENPEIQEEPGDEEEEDNEDEEDAVVEDAADANNGAQDDMNWNALEWDRAAEELTWERMLGLDGSLVFLEHVFWVVSLNTLFILVFGGFCMTAVPAENSPSPSPNSYASLLKTAGKQREASSGQGGTRRWALFWGDCPFKLRRGMGGGHTALRATAQLKEAAAPLTLRLNAASCILVPVVPPSVCLKPSCFLCNTFCPYHIGHFSVVGLGFEEYVQASHFEGLITTIVGYVLLAINLIVCHGLAALVKFQRSRRLLGVCYIVVKVSLLVVVEIGVFPLICGWWLDICSLEMFDATLKDRELSFQSAPGTTMFLHWLVGMVYVFYFASFILLLREVLRPGVLWFLRNLNDPDFNPVQEMIHLPIYRHLRRFILSVIVFGSIVLLMLWLPIRIIKYLLPNFLPYNVMLYSDAPVSELSLELLLLQVVLPALLEQGHTRQWLKGLVRAWTVTAGYLLDLHSYLLGDQEENENNANQQPNNQHARNNNAIPVVGEGLHAAHQAILQQGGPVGFQPYHRPLKFPLRIFLLIVFMCITLLIASLICLTLPGESITENIQIIKEPSCILKSLPEVTSTPTSDSVFAGRWLMSFWTGAAKIHELYTAACGLYVCWLTIRAVTVLVAWMPQGRRVIFQKVKEWSLMIMKTLIVAVLLAGVVPLLLGLLFELVIVAPLRVPLDQTPLFYPWQDWALGVLHAKIIAAITLMGPQWWLKTVIEQVYANGIRNIDLHFIIRKLATPVISVLLLSLCIPYIIASGVVPLLGVTAEMQNLVQRRIYPFLLMVVVLMGILSFQVRQFKRLYEHIKNDKYLVGQRLVNYERKSGKQSTSPPPPQSAQA